MTQRAVFAMSRVDLLVPFAEKEDAKRLGARWDAAQKTWYVPDGIDSVPFERWLPEPETPIIRAPTWSVVGAPRKCWVCGVVTPVFAIALPPGYEVLNGEEDRWERAEGSVLLSYVSDVPRSVAAQLNLLAPRYRIDYSQTIHSFYWMNHCEHCGAKLGDFETMEEPGTFYVLRGFDECKLIIEEFHPVKEPFSGICGGIIEVE